MYQLQKQAQRSMLDNKMLKYVGVVRRLNEYRKKGNHFAPLSLFSEVAFSVDDRDSV